MSSSQCIVQCRTISNLIQSFTQIFISGVLLSTHYEKWQNYIFECQIKVFGRDLSDNFLAGFILPNTFF